MHCSRCWFHTHFFRYGPMGGLTGIVLAWFFCFWHEFLGVAPSCLCLFVPNLLYQQKQQWVQKGSMATKALAVALTVALQSLRFVKQKQHKRRGTTTECSDDLWHCCCGWCCLCSFVLDLLSKCHVSIQRTSGHGTASTLMTPQCAHLLLFYLTDTSLLCSADLSNWAGQGLNDMN